MSTVTFVAITGPPNGVSVVLDTYFRNTHGVNPPPEMTVIPDEPVISADAATQDAVNTDAPQDAETLEPAVKQKRTRKAKTEPTVEAAKDAEPAVEHKTESKTEPVTELPAPVSSESGQSLDEFGLNPSAKDYAVKLMDLARETAAKQCELRGIGHIKQVLTGMKLPNVQACPDDKLAELIKALQSDG